MSIDPETIPGVLAALPSDGIRGVRFLDGEYNQRFYAYDALRVQVYRTAAKLRSAGVRRGDRVGLVLPEHEHFLLGFLAASALGAIVVPMASRSGSSPKSKDAYRQTTNHVARASRSRFLLCDASNRELLSDLFDAALDLELLAIESLLAPDGELVEPAPVRADDLCFLQFTSGSTSMPKGVMVSHRNIVANARAFLGPEGSIRRRHDDVVLGWLPFFHDMGLMCLAVGPLVVDLPAVLLPTEVFARRPWSWMTAMSRFRGTVTFAPNFAYELATKLTRERDLESMDLSAVRVAGCGAEPINAQVLRRFCQRFAGTGLAPEAMVPCYGMAEATVAISFHPAGTPMAVDRVDADALRSGFAALATESSREALEIVSCGQPVTAHEIQIVTERGALAGEREVGEITFRGGSVTQGYYQHREATDEVFRDGWLHTGDLGYRVGENVYVCGRLKDIVIVNGVNYYPQDIEWAVQGACDVHPNRVVAFSVMRDARELVVVCLEPKHREPVRELQRRVVCAVEERVGVRVHQVAVLERGELTLTSSGKVQRRKTKQLFEAGELRERQE